MYPPILTGGKATETGLVFEILHYPLVHATLDPDVSVTIGLQPI